MSIHLYQNDLHLGRIEKVRIGPGIAQGICNRPPPRRVGMQTAVAPVHGQAARAGADCIFPYPQAKSLS